jgi:hypothetical protein
VPGEVENYVFWGVGTRCSQDLHGIFMSYTHRDISRASQSLHKKFTRETAETVISAVSVRYIEPTDLPEIFIGPDHELTSL